LKVVELLNYCGTTLRGLFMPHSISAAIETPKLSSGSSVVDQNICRRSAFAVELEGEPAYMTKF
jgi:hypothetical protein